MKKADVHIGGHYIAKVSGREAEIVIVAESPYGGWDARSMATCRAIRIRSAQRLRREVMKVQPPLAPPPRLS